MSANEQKKHDLFDLGLDGLIDGAMELATPAAAGIGSVLAWEAGIERIKLPQSAPALTFPVGEAIVGAIVGPLLGSYLGDEIGKAVGIAMISSGVTRALRSASMTQKLFPLMPGASLPSIPSGSEAPSAAGLGANPQETLLLGDSAVDVQEVNPQLGDSAVEVEDATDSFGSVGSWVGG